MTTLFTGYVIIIFIIVFLLLLIDVVARLFRYRERIRLAQEKSNLAEFAVNRRQISLTGDELYKLYRGK